MGLVQYNNQEIHTQRVFFTGTATLDQGQPLCFQESPATASSTKGFPFDVELPSAANVGAFAGIVADTHVGVTGPAFIDILVPKSGDILQVLLGAVEVRGNVAVGDILALSNSVTTVSTANDGAFVKAALYDHSASFTAASNATSYAIGSAVMGALAPLIGGQAARALESLASVSASSLRARSLKWVRFL